MGDLLPLNPCEAPIMQWAEAACLAEAESCGGCKEQAVSSYAPLQQLRLEQWTRRGHDTHYQPTTRSCVQVPCIWGQEVPKLSSVPVPNHSLFFLSVLFYFLTL